MYYTIYSVYYIYICHVTSHLKQNKLNRGKPRVGSGQDTLTFDFSSKGGPANVEGKWDGTGIVFPDGILMVDAGIGGDE